MYVTTTVFLQLFLGHIWNSSQITGLCHFAGLVCKLLFLNAPVNLLIFTLQSEWYANFHQPLIDCLRNRTSHLSDYVWDKQRTKMWHLLRENFKIISKVMHGLLDLKPDISRWSYVVE